MSGNVCEWTRSLRGRDSEKPDFGYPYDLNDRSREDLTADDQTLRVVRGGAWNDHRFYARCAIRYWAQLDSRCDFIGFRVVLRCAPVS